MKLLRSRSRALEATATLLSLALLVTPASAMMDCSNIVVDGEKFDFSALDGPHSLVTSHKPPQVYELVNTTYTLNICKSLVKDGPANESCPNGARGEQFLHFLFQYVFWGDALIYFESKEWKKADNATCEKKK